MTESIKEGLENETSLTTRIAIWKGTLKAIKNNILTGNGIGTFVWFFPKYRPKTLHSTRPHFAYNEYLHMAAEMGLLAPCIMIWGLLILIKIELII